MENVSFADDPQSAAPRRGGFTLDYKRILFHAVRFWYFIALSFFIGVGLAYAINRYVTRIYPVTASIIIRENKENTDAAAMLYSNPLVNTYRNFYNELYIIRSYPLVTSVVEDLNFHVRVIKEGDIKTTEQYNSVPIQVELLSKRVRTSLRLEILAHNRFSCAGLNNEKRKEFSANDTVTYQNAVFVVRTVGDLSDFQGDKYLVQFLDPADVARIYVDKLKAGWAAQGSSVMNLELSGSIPQKEIDFLNTLIDHYRQKDLERKNSAASRSLDFIRDQLADMRDSLRIFENALESFKKQNFVTDLTEEAKSLYEQLKVLGEQRATVQYASNYYDYLENYLLHGKDREQIILPSSVGIQDPVLDALTTKLMDTQLQYNGVVISGGAESNPLVTGKRDVLTGLMTDLRKQLMEALKNVRATDKIKLGGISKQIRDLEKKLQGLPVAERRLVNIQRNYTLSENLYIFLLQKHAEAGITKASTTTDIEVVNSPRQSGGAITPKVMQNYITFGGAGLALPFVIFVLIELLNNRVQSRDDIERMTAIPFLGGIGHKQGENNLVVYDKPKSAIAESFRALRSNLNYFTAGKDRKVFMITSSLSGEGKTFTTINLATVFALSGKKTLIIGGDLRKPKIFNDFNLSNDKGLSTYLSGINTLEEVLQPTGLPHLDLISGGPVPPNPSELILNDTMDAMMTELKKRYDFIMLDTPPMALITDGLVLSKYADHVIYLVRQNYTPRVMLQSVDEAYVSGKLKNVSLVLNDVYRSGPGYGYGSYGYGFGYGYGPGYGYGYLEGGAGKRNKNGAGYYTED